MKIDFIMYCQLVTIVCIMMGMMLFLYCMVAGISIVSVGASSSPLLYLGIGMMFGVASIVKKYEHLIKEEA